MSASIPRLSAPLERVEALLPQLAEGLAQSDLAGLERVAGELQAALTQLMAEYRSAQRAGEIPGPLQQRVAAARAQVGLQREALARATASIERAMDVLVPERSSAARSPYAGAGPLKGRPQTVA